MTCFGIPAAVRLESKGKVKIGHNLVTIQCKSLFRNASMGFNFPTSLNVADRSEYMCAAVDNGEEISHSIDSGFPTVVRFRSGVSPDDRARSALRFTPLRQAIGRPPLNNHRPSFTPRHRLAYSGDSPYVTNAQQTGQRNAGNTR